MSAIDAILAEEETEYYPGTTQYVVDIFIPNQEPQSVTLRRDNFHGTFSADDRTHPVLLKIAVNCVREYLAKIYTQGSY